MIIRYARTPDPASESAKKHGCICPDDQGNEVSDEGWKIMRVNELCPVHSATVIRDKRLYSGA
jgi:hypothetical protein